MEYVGAAFSIILLIAALAISAWFALWMLRFFCLLAVACFVDGMNDARRRAREFELQKQIARMRGQQKQIARMRGQRPVMPPYNVGTRVQYEDEGGQRRGRAERWFEQ
ncbi:MAG TPA: hypothetical protein VN107_10610 [Microbacterium sp.]|nr:hypothetical protein [Microbacterium sp.]